MRIRVMPLHLLHAHMLHALQHAPRALSGRGGHAQERDQLAKSERVRTGSIVLVGAGRPRKAADAIADSRGATSGGNLCRYGRQADMNLCLQAHETQRPKSFRTKHIQVRLYSSNTWMLIQ